MMLHRFVLTVKKHSLLRSSLPCVNGLSFLPIAKLPEQCFAILRSFGIVLGLKIEELLEQRPQLRFTTIGSFEIVLG